MAHCECPSKTAHWPAGYPTTTITLFLQNHPSFLDKNGLSCLLPLFVFNTLIWIRVKPLPHLPLWHASSGFPLIFTSFGWDVVPVGHFSLKKFKKKPQNKLPPFSLPLDHSLSYPWLVAHLPCIGWVLVGGVWALCAHFTSIWIHYFSGLHAYVIASAFVWFSCTFCLTPTAWKIHGPLGLRSLLSISSLDWALLRCKPSPSCLAHVLFYPVSMGFLADDPTIPLHCSCYFIPLLPMG